MADEAPDSMAGADWAAVYDRQAARGGLVPRLADLLDLVPGDRVLEVGCGPGHATAVLADRVAPGRVVALDRHRGALDYLRDVTRPDPDAVDPVVGDVRSLPVRFDAPTPALLAFVLHHVEAPARALEAVAAALPAGSAVLVAEYDPGAPGEVGPPPDRRIGPGDVAGWLDAAGLASEAPVDLPEEAYAVRARRTPGADTRGL